MKNRDGAAGFAAPRVWKNVARLLVAATVAAGPLYLMAGCGGGGSSSSTTPTPTATPTPVPTPSAGGLILYSSSNVSGGVYQQIYYINGQGAGTTRLSNNGSDETPGGWSPDGTKILFSSNRDNNGGVNSRDIYRMDSTAANVTRLTNDTTKNSVNPSWSSDGKKIAFVHAKRIAVMNADGSGLTDLTDESLADPFSPVWSPDGTKIAFVAAPAAAAANARTIYLMGADGGNRTALTAGDEYIHQVAWSPDGRTLIYDGSRDTGGVSSLRTQIYRINPDGTGRVRLTENAGSDISPAWSPDGTKIVSSSNRDTGGGSGGANPYDLYTMNADGSNPIRLTTGRLNAFAPSAAWKP